MSDLRPNRPTQRQYAIRRLVALFVVLALLTGGFILARNLVVTLTDRFQSAMPTETPTVKETPSKSKGPVLSACDDNDIDIEVSLEEGTELKVGDAPTVKAIIENIGSSTCLRDIGSSANEVYIENADGHRVWSSNRCPVKQTARLIEFKPGDRYQITTLWPGTGNPRKCGEVAKTVAAGDFSVFVSNGSAVSEALALTLN